MFCLFARIVGVKLLPQALFVLRITVWIIYTTDHLIDAAMVKHQASSASHRFHQEHFRTLLIALIIPGVTDFALTFLVRRPLLGCVDGG